MLTFDARCAFVGLGRSATSLALLSRAAHVKLKIIHMEDDGNCQFRSLASELYGDQEFHGLVRQKVVEHLRTHGDSFSFFVGDAGEWAAYLQVVCEKYPYKLSLKKEPYLSQ